MINKVSLREIYCKIKSYYVKAEDKNQIFLSDYKLENNVEDHMIRVSKYTEILADLLCIDNEKINQIKKGALLHDIGKKMIDREILNKPSKLTIEVFEKIKEHSKLGLKVLNKKHGNEIVENIILFHHEKWNGKGYPFGLSKKDIPIEARIVSIVDCYDALTSTRVYKDKISHEEALKILKSENGKSFDPDLVSMFEIFENKFSKK